MGNGAHGFSSGAVHGSKLWSCWTSTRAAKARAQPGSLPDHPTSQDRRELLPGSAGTSVWAIARQRDAKHGCLPVRGRAAPERSALHAETPSPSWAPTGARGARSHCGNLHRQQLGCSTRTSCSKHAPACSRPSWVTEASLGKCDAEERGFGILGVKGGAGCSGLFICLGFLLFTVPWQFIR